jgi:hypothetical protein
MMMEDLLSYSYTDARLTLGSHSFSNGLNVGSYEVAQAGDMKAVTLSLRWTDPLGKTTSSYAIATVIAQGLHE